MLHDIDSRLAAQVDFWKAQVHRYPPLDAPDRGEQGVLDYANAVDTYVEAVSRQDRFRARMAEIAAAREEPVPQIDMDDCLVV